MPLSDEEKEQLAGLLSTALNKPPQPKLSLNERLSAAEIIRKWLWIAIVGVLVVGAFVWQVKTNTSRIAHLEAIDREMRPKTRTMWWMKESGLTNEEMKEQNIQAPDFKVLDYEE